MDAARTGMGRLGNEGEHGTMAGGWGRTTIPGGAERAGQGGLIEYREGKR